ncbi:HMG box domain-containing protein [Aphelenchoides besseyi]|nr:HMG box domain-containing protein [Aphelenchoides besseyi]
MSSPFDFFSPQEIQKFTFSNAHDFQLWTDIQPTLTVQCSTAHERSQKSSRQSSAYALFFKDHQPMVRSQLKDATFGQISKAIAALWESISVTEKESYKRRVQEIKRQRLLENAMNGAQFLCQEPPQLRNPEREIN